MVALLPGERSHDSFGVAIRPSVFARGFLAWSMAELGQFAEAEEIAQDALRLAEIIGHPQTVAAGLLAVGTFHVKRGDVGRAVAPFERARELCVQHEIPLWRPVFSSFLGYSLALSGRLDEARGLLRDALEQSALMRLGVFYSQMVMWLAEAQLLAGAIGEAADLAEEALASTRERKERGLEAWALRLAAEVTALREPLDLRRPEDLYQQAMALAEKLGTPALIARCHLGLGMLYRRAGQPEEADASLGIAAGLFRSMGMRFWPERADAERRLLPHAVTSARRASARWTITGPKTGGQSRAHA